MPREIDLALEGGGGKGHVYVSAFAALDELKVKIRRIAGTSAGAIFASHVAFGYTTEELAELIDPRSPKCAPWHKFKDVGWSPWISGATATLPGLYEAAGWALDRLAEQALLSNQHVAISHLWDNTWAVAGTLAASAGAALATFGGTLFRRLHWDGGVFLGDKIEEWVRLNLRRKLKERTGEDRDATFGDSVIPLTVVASDTVPENNATKCVYFSTEVTPSVPVHEAVRASMCLPLVFTVKKIGFGYPGKKVYQSELLDGGLFSNLPLDCFADGNGMIGPQVFGLLLDEGPPHQTQLSWIAPNVGRLRYVLEAQRVYHDSIMQSKHAGQIIKLPVGDYSVYKFKPSTQEYLSMGERARTAVLNHAGLRAYLRS